MSSYIVLKNMEKAFKELDKIDEWRLNKMSKIKVAYCFCGEIVTASVMPYAEIDRETISMFRWHAKKGHKIDYVENVVKIKLFSSCQAKCPKTEESNNQLSLLEYKN